MVEKKIARASESEARAISFSCALLRERGWKLKLGLPSPFERRVCSRDETRHHRTDVRECGVRFADQRRSDFTLQRRWRHIGIAERRAAELVEERCGVRG